MNGLKTPEVLSESTDVLEPYQHHLLRSTNFTDFGERRQGKASDVYEQDDTVTIVATDRFSAFDRNLVEVPFKGEVLTATSRFWRHNAARIADFAASNSSPDPNVTIAKKCEVIPIEVVVRGYVTGVTATSMWSLYDSGKREFGDIILPDGLHKNHKLAHPLVTPTTKNPKHDLPISAYAAIQRGLVKPKTWGQMQDIALRLYNFGTKLAEQRGLILVDTKYEFGLDEDGNLMVIDELHTGDSSRYWENDNYWESVLLDKEPEYYDKEFMRLWYKERCDPYVIGSELPAPPLEVVLEMARRYIWVYERLTGKSFQPAVVSSIRDRIETNLRQYWSER